MKRMDKSKKNLIFCFVTLVVMVSVMVSLVVMPLNANQQQPGAQKQKVVYRYSDYDVETLVDKDTLATKPEDPLPEVEGEHFIGWFYNGSDRIFDFDTTIVSQDIILEAKFDRRYIARFYDGNGIYSYQMVEKMAKLKNRI